MKKKKNIILISIISIFFVIGLIYCFSNKKEEIFKNEYIVGTTYLPKENEIHLDNSELSTFLNRLVYPSIIKFNISSYDEILSKKISINNDEITVVFKEDIANFVLESYKKLGREPYENNWKANNIIGFEEYTKYEKDEIDGIKIDKNNQITFKVKNTNSLDFLTMPIVCGDIGEYKIAEYNDYENIVLKNDKDKDIIIKLIDYEQIETVDMFITCNDEIEISNNYNVQKLFNKYDLLVLNNYNKEDIQSIKNIIDGKKETLEKIYFWCDSSYQGALLTQKLKEIFENNGTKFNIDYAEKEVLLKQIDNNENSYMFYYEDNYYDKNDLTTNHTTLINIETKPIYFYYKSNMNKLIEKYF